MSKRNITTKSALLLAAAVVLVGAGTIGTTRALPNASSANHDVDAQTKNIGVAILENNEEVEEGVLSLYGVDDDVLLGKAYEEDIAVANTGDIDAYIRVTVKTYWLDKEGKNVSVDPTLIDLNVVDGWIEGASTAEKTVYYYPSVVASGDAVALADTITISKDVASKATVTVADGVRTVTFAYDDLCFAVEVTADAVQTHNADKAIKSVWGVDAAAIGIDVAE